MPKPGEAVAPVAPVTPAVTPQAPPAPAGPVNAEEVVDQFQDVETPDVHEMGDDELAKIASGQTPGQKADDATTTPVAKAGDPATTTNQPAPEPTEAEKVAAENERLRRQVEQQERFIQTNHRRLGEENKALRAELQARVTDADKRYEENLLKDPAQARRAANDAMEAERMIQEMDQVEFSAQRAVQSKSFVMGQVNDFESLLPVMAEVLAADGKASPQEIAWFMRNPWTEHPGFLLQLSQRARLFKDGKVLSEKVKALETENSKLKSKPEETVRKIAEAARGPAITAGTGGSTVQQGSSKFSGLTENQVADLSDEDLALMQKELS